MTTSMLNARPHVTGGLTRRRVLGGVSMATALRLPVALGRLAPQLAAAVDGTPATTGGQR